MKSQREIYQALLSGKTLIDRSGRKVSLKNTIDTPFDIPENWEIYNELADLKKVFEEGALIEVRSQTTGEWIQVANPCWLDDHVYRIKDGIGIEFWNKWKTLIKAFWEGKTLQYRYDNGWRDWLLKTMPKDFDRMRIKPESTLYYRWKKIVNHFKIDVTRCWYREGHMPDGNYNWIRIEPGKTFEEI